MDVISLQSILEGFNAPVNEEQAWAVCYQCADFLQREWERSHCFTFTGLNSLELSKDGHVSKIKPFSDSKLARTEYELVKCMGIVLFQALDYGLSETEEQTLSPTLEHLMEQMIAVNNQNEDQDGDMDDEGIEDAGEEESEHNQNQRISLAHVKKACCDHLQSQVEPSSHYKAVCRALVAEAIELITFLEKISTDKEKLKPKDGKEEEGATLEVLEKADWARLWIQVMRELRTGIKLKKKDCVKLSPVEYELTPYEVLMKDIRARKHNLKQVTVNGNIPQRTKKDAHDIILEFIRSRPPLHPAKERKLPAAPVRALDIREMLLQEIRGEPRLKPTPGGKVIETSRTKLDDDSSPLPAKKVLKPDLNLLDFDNDDDSSLESESEDELEDRNRVSPSPFSPITPLSPPKSVNTNWRQTVVEDLLKQKRGPPVRRHSISVCETPRHPNTSSNKPSVQNSLECLSLTVEEVMHIRNVLTKSELESLLVDPKLHELVAKGKVCFTCLKTKFSLFGPWSTQCKFCQRHVCSKCISKMRIPTEHFENIPVYTLSPSPVGQESATDIQVHENTGSAPNSPELSRKSYTPSSPESSEHSSNNNNEIKPRRKVGRSATMRQATPARPILQGPMMNICRDCKAMILNIIKSSRSSLNKAPVIRKDVLIKRSNGASLVGLSRSSSSCSSNANGVHDRSSGSEVMCNKPKRDFHLDLKPVYKAK